MLRYIEYPIDTINIPIQVQFQHHSFIFSHDSKKPDVLSEELGLEGEKPSAEDQMKMKWESLHQEFSIKQKLLQNALEQEQDQPVSM